MPVHVFSSRPAPSPFEDSLLYANFLLTTSILSILECPVCYLRGWNYNLLLPSPGSKFVNVHGKSEISIRKPIILNQSNFDHRNWMQLRVAYCRPPFTGHRCHRPTRAPVPPVDASHLLTLHRGIGDGQVRFAVKADVQSQNTLCQLPGRFPNVRITVIVPWTTPPGKPEITCPRPWPAIGRIQMYYKSILVVRPSFTHLAMDQTVKSSMNMGEHLNNEEGFWQPQPFGSHLLLYIAVSASGIWMDILWPATCGNVPVPSPASC